MLQPELIQTLITDGREADPGEPTTARILDAALAEFRSFGLRRATLEDITRRAKVGRMTLHRRFPSKQALIGAVFLREIRRTLDQVDAVIAEHDHLTDQLVEGLAHGIRAVHDNPLFSRLLETDSEAMLPYLTVEAQPLMIAASGYVAGQIRRADPTVADALAAQVGESIIRCCHSILLTPEGHNDLQDQDALREFIRAPIVALLGLVETR